MKSVKDVDAEKSNAPLQHDQPVKISAVKKLAIAARALVRDGQW